MLKNNQNDTPENKILNIEKTPKKELNMIFYLYLKF